jgi:predicted DNA-binding protein
MRLPTVPKKKKGESKQINVRFPADLAERLENTSETLGMDASSLLRMLVIEHLAEYEERGRRARGEEGGKP